MSCISHCSTIEKASSSVSGDATFLKIPSIIIQPKIEPLYGKQYTQFSTQSDKSQTSSPKIRGQSGSTSPLRNIELINTTKAGKAGSKRQSLVGVDGIPCEQLFNRKSPIQTRVKKQLNLSSKGKHNVRFSLHDFMTEGKDIDDAIDNYKTK